MSSVAGGELLVVMSAQLITDILSYHTDFTFFIAICLPLFQHGAGGLASTLSFLSVPFITAGLVQDCEHIYQRGM